MVRADILFGRLKVFINVQKVVELRAVEKRVNFFCMNGYEAIDFM